MKRLGIDIGSHFLSAVVTQEGRILSRSYDEHRGEIGRALRSVLSRHDFSSWDLAGVTGSGASNGAARLIDGTLATIEGARALLPNARTVIAIGGQSFTLILLDENGAYLEHSTNPPCASGTGSFLEQQAERLGLSAREFSERAAGFSGTVPRIATRCAVFAKTDTIHAIQEGHTLEAVCAGLCEGIARSVLDSLRRGRPLHPPIGLVGGVSLNRKIASSLQALLGMEVIVPEDSHLAGAVGAALLGDQRTLDMESLAGRSRARREVRDPLPRTLGDYPDFSRYDVRERDGVEILLPRTRVQGNGTADLPARGPFMGLDIGSTSTKAVIIDADAGIVGGFYTRTAAEPVAAVQRLLRSMVDVFPGNPRLQGVCTTGSGRKMIREVFQADREVNEITAHARAAVLLQPGVDTIVEIGGQDSKFTRINDGEVSFSTMNYVCAAGTGSFIEEQAKRLGVTLAEFSDMALSDRAPFTSDRCTVYMERDIGEMLAEGWPREALAAAVLHSVRDNYLSKVVGRTALGDCVVFQGATARNPALVAAFEQLLGKTMHVSPLCHLTGALGAALLCREKGDRGSRFLWETGPIGLSVEECRLCVNRCQLTVAERSGTRTGWGMKCGREYSDRKAAVRGGLQQMSAVERRFQESFTALRAEPPALPARAAARAAITIGIPRSLYIMESEPLWHCFIRLLGFSAVASTPRQEALDQGIAAVNSDFCAPMILAHGHVRQLLEEGADYVFAPALANEREGDEPIPSDFRKKVSDSAYCYYSQYLPSVIGKLTAFAAEDRLISPLLPLREKSDPEIAGLIHAELSRRFPDILEEETVEAYRAARGRFLAARKPWTKGFERLSGSATDGERLRIVLLGRPYSVFDPVLNLSIPRIIEEQGADVFWQEELDLDHEQPGLAGQYLARMHWHYGKRILLAAQVAARTRNLYPVFLTSFRCSPDAFLITYLRDIFSSCGKPFLILQLDAHASEVGYVTRIESAVQAFRGHRKKQRAAAEPEAAAPAAATRVRDDALQQGNTVLIAAVDELISRFWVDTFSRAGYRGVLLQPSPSALSTGYRYASGGECMPLAAIVGAAVELARNKAIDPGRAFFFMPTTPLACNIPQFPIFAAQAFRAAGFGDIKVGLLNFLSLGESLPQSISIGIVEDYILACTLYKLLYRIQPYETEKGAAQRAFQAAGDLVSQAIANGGDARGALARGVELFKSVPRDESSGRKPRIALLGDLYVKYSNVVSQGILSLIEELGGELVISSMSEYPAHLLDFAARRHGENPRSYRMLRAIEQRFEKIADELIGDQREPDIGECVQLMERYGLRHSIAGETSINVGRALWYCAHRSVEAIVHVNPMFCCPGVVSASLFRKIQEDFKIPIIDIFYDGTGNPNGVLIPHLHYLGRNGRPAG